MAEQSSSLSQAKSSSSCSSRSCGFSTTNSSPIADSSVASPVFSSQSPSSASVLSKLMNRNQKRRLAQKKRRIQSQLVAEQTGSTSKLQQAHLDKRAKQATKTACQLFLSSLTQAREPYQQEQEINKTKIKSSEELETHNYSFEFRQDSEHCLERASLLAARALRISSYTTLANSTTRINPTPADGLDHIYKNLFKQ